MITFTVNGQVRKTPQALSIFDLMIDLNLQNKKIAVEKNGKIVPKSLHTTVVLEQNDNIEIVTAVGGG